MSSRRAVLAAATSVVMSAVAAQDYESHAGGKFEALLLSAVASMRQGSCPTAIMADRFIEACRHGSAAMAQRLGALGQPVHVHFEGSWGTPDGCAEMYEIQFARGRLEWQIGAAGDGRISLLWITGN